MAGSVPVLLAGRAVTGAGAALVMPATLSILIHATAPERRPQAVATWTLMTGVGGLLGNAVGGPILEFLPWQGLFAVLAPRSRDPARLLPWLLPTVPRTPAALDPVGSALLTAGFLAVLYGIIEGPDLGWTSGRVVAAFAVGAALVAAFVGYALRAAAPLLDPGGCSPAPHCGRRPRHPRRVHRPLLAVLRQCAVPVRSRARVRRPAHRHGDPAAGRRHGRRLAAQRPVRRPVRDARAVTLAGMLLIALGLFLMSLLSAGTPYLLYLVYVTSLSAGFGLVGPAMSTTVIAALPAERAGLGSGLNGAAREFGSALGVAIFGSILASRFAAELPSRSARWTRSARRSRRRRGWVRTGTTSWSARSPMRCPPRSAVSRSWCWSRRDSWRCGRGRSARRVSRPSPPVPTRAPHGRCPPPRP
ncbi:MFS transporter [Yinghuangia aomiensis]